MGKETSRFMACEMADDYPTTGSVMEDIQGILSKKQVDAGHVPFLLLKGLAEFITASEFEDIKKWARSLAPVKKRLMCLESEIKSYLSENADALNTTQVHIEHLITNLVEKGPRKIDKIKAFFGIRPGGTPNSVYENSFLANCRSQGLDDDSYMRLKYFSNIGRIQIDDSKLYGANQAQHSPFRNLQYMLVSLPLIMMGDDAGNRKLPGLYARYNYLKASVQYYNIFESAEERTARQRGIRALEHHVDEYQSRLAAIAARISYGMAENIRMISRYRNDYDRLKHIHWKWKNNMVYKDGYIRVSESGRMLLNIMNDDFSTVYPHKKVLEVPYEVTERVLADFLGRNRRPTLDEPYQHSLNQLTRGIGLFSQEGKNTHPHRE